ncbi:hypothetical protein L226DRAFT_529369 [Lentinus tigrinus ALCF2SS1-7]|uniref:Uncharacterized protein n=1 Tax=Lentinus tigrinus ALCF2SS1-6 TaxID=1328759 RepID=A0A5C2SSU8_9APHY|nr:hypothetical protein L227DRAFT_569182 [Lentinus tigrinus ALCF2SS1-6]RPD80917.1 hypothetical protein L226DRAFT_529369 [Lentinus tigrinus ALCF2SS1-7]
MSDDAAASASTSAAIKETPRPEEPAQTTDVDNAPDQQFMDVLVRTQNECLSELGYYPTLLSEFQEMQKTCAKLHADNQKLYSDNRSLAHFIAQQNQRMALLQAPGDQQKRTIAELYESVRIVTNQRDELQARLHATLHEVAVLRQELSRFVPDALISPRDRMPAPASMPQQAHLMQTGQAPSHHVIVPPPGANMQGLPPNPNTLQYYRAPPPKAGVQGSHNPFPQHRGSAPILLPLDTSVTPAIAQHRRPSAPAALNFMHTAPGQSPASASPSNTFAGLSLASSPSTPVSSRPGTASGQMASLPRYPSGSRPSSSRGIHVAPPVMNNPSSSSLAGAIIDLTQDESREDSARKRRKLEHTPSVVIPQASGAAPVPSPATPFGQDVHSRHSPIQTVVAQPFTVPQSHSQPHHTSSAHSHRSHQPEFVNPFAPATTPPQYTHNPPVAAPQSRPPLSQIIAHSQSMPQSQSIPQSQLPPQHQQPAQAQAPPVQPSNPASSVPVQKTSAADTPVPDAVMADAASEPVPTLEEECIEANYDEDDDDEAKLWCRMCRSRFNGGHTTEKPTPFINASPQQLVEHCETIHPRGWEILQSKVAAQRDS